MTDIAIIVNFFEDGASYATKRAAECRDSSDPQVQAKAQAFAVQAEVLKEMATHSLHALRSGAEPRHKTSH